MHSPPLSRRAWLQQAGTAGLAGPTALVLASQLSAAPASRAPAERAPQALGRRRELLVDEQLIAEFSGGARLKLHHPAPREVAIRFNAPWEGNTSGYVTVLTDPEAPGTLRMIYQGHRMIWDNKRLRMSHSPVVCYAESDDGITWRKPQLGIFPWRGQGAERMSDPKANNIVWPGSSESNTFVPFLDQRPGVPREERFKAVGGIHKTGLYLFRSPDAIHWKRSDEPIFRHGALDSMNVVFWAPERERYVIYFRTVVDGLRSIATSSSEDLRNWTEPVPLEYPGSPPQQMYTNQIAPYYRAPHLWLGFPTRYVARPMTGQLEALEPVELRRELTDAYPRVGSDLTDSLFMSSRDGVTFRRWDDAFLRPGPQAPGAHGRWTYGDNYQNYGLFETASATPGAPPEISLLFSEGYWREGQGRMRRYTMRLDGFVSATAPYAGGKLITHPLRFTGGELVVNYSTSAAGSLKLELQDQAGRPLDGFSLDDCIELIGDRIDQPVRWQGGSDLRNLAGKPIRLCAVLRDADLYAFQFR